MKIIVAATPDVAIPTLNWLITSEHQLLSVITQPDRPAGRGRTLKESVISEWARENDVPCFKPASVAETATLIEGADVLLTIGYGVLLPEELLSIPMHGCLNLHFSLLPAYRGAAPAQRCLQNGDSVTGVSVFQLEKGMDTGPIYAQSSIEINPSWRSFELLSVLAQEGPAVVDRALTMISDGVSPTPQSGTATLAAKISKAEAQLDFTQSAESVVNAIRAFTYEPGSWSLWKGEPFKITAAISNNEIHLEQGEIVVLDKKVFIGCGNQTAIEILSVIPAGKKEMSSIDWARGARLQGGEHFG